MTQNTKNQRGKNVILISQPSDRGFGDEFSGLYSRQSSLNSQFAPYDYNSFRRQSSLGGNLFKTFNNGQKPVEQVQQQIQQPKISDAQKYAQECLEYEKYQFDDRIRLIIHRMAIRAYQHFKEKNQHDFLSFSIQKLLGIIAKKMLLNRFELLFLEYVFEETKWKFDIQCIAKHASEYVSYAHLGQGQTLSAQAKQLQIYFLYCSFYSKKSLNQLPNDSKASKNNKFNGLTGYLRSLCRKFSAYFQEWTQFSNVSNIKINPKVLNSIFKRLTFYSDRENEQIQNYTLLVEEILEISPAYNAQKGGKKRKTSKPKKEEPLPDIKENEESQEVIQHQQGSSEELIDMHTLPNKKQTSYLSNVDGLEPMSYISKNQRLI